MKVKPNKELIKVLADHQGIYESLLELFNSGESALSWLKKPSKPLCNSRPIDWFIKYTPRKSYRYHL